MENETPLENPSNFDADSNDEDVAAQPEPDSTGTAVDIEQDTGENDDGQKEINQNVDQAASPSPSPELPDLTLPQLSDEVDKFLASLSAAEGDPGDPPVPNSVEAFAGEVELIVGKYDSGDSKFGQSPDEDSLLIEALNRLSMLARALRDRKTTPSLNRLGNVLQHAMSLLEEELRVLLEDSSKDSRSNKEIPNRPKSTKKTANSQSSFKDIFSSSSSSSSDHHNHESSPMTTTEGSDTPMSTVQDFPAFSPEKVSEMNRIATVMISAGYETECCQVYSIARRQSFKEALKELGLDRIGMDDVQKMPWETLNGEIANWIKVVNHCAAVLFPGEKKLCESVFSSSSEISRSLFGNLARAVVIQLLNFAEAISMTKRSAEKLFIFLDMYETLRDLVPKAMNDEDENDDCAHELKSETSAAGHRLGEAAVGNFCDLENSIKSNTTGKTAVPGGALHPLTRYTMNYLTYACEYKETLEQIFLQYKQGLEGSEPGPTKSDPDQAEGQTNNDRANKPSPFSVQLGRVMELLDLNLEANSKLYKDPSLRSIFLMNNGRYILQKIKKSAEIHEVMGDTWYRKRSSELRQYHKTYQRETWVRVLGFLRDDGLSVNGKVSKPMLKERFKSFNATFEEIHRTQSTWVVSDEQLQSELRVSISALVIPAYRSFLGRFQQYLDSGRQSNKYIKLQPEDIETAIDDLFSGSPTTMAKRRT